MTARHAPAVTDVPTHSAQIAYPDAEAVGRAIGELDGLAYLEAARDGRISLDPFTAALGLEVAEVAPGTVTFRATVQDWQVNGGLIAHGGFLSSLMDHTCGLALHTQLDAGWSCPHVSASYRFAKAARLGTVLTCRGVVLHHGRTTGVTRCELHDADDRLLATGDATHAITQLFDGAAVA